MYLIENSLTESSTVSILSNNPYALYCCRIFRQGSLVYSSLLENALLGTVGRPLHLDVSLDGFCLLFLNCTYILAGDNHVEIFGSELSIKYIFYSAQGLI